MKNITTSTLKEHEHNEHHSKDNGLHIYKKLQEETKWDRSKACLCPHVVSCALLD